MDAEAPPPTPGALAGIRVVDLTRGPCGGRATAVLADFGADVLRVLPSSDHTSLGLASSPFWQRGKSTTTVDPSDRAAMGELFDAADVVVADGPRRRLVDAGFDADSVRNTRPGLVHCTITGFGAPLDAATGVDGPTDAWPGHEGLVAAWAGRMAGFGVQLNEDRPVYAALPVATHMASQGAVHGILAALLQRQRTGEGDVVETSLLQGLTCFDLVDQMMWQLHDGTADDFVPLRLASEMPTLNYHPLLTSDGRWIQCGNLLEHLFMSFLDAIDMLGELLVDERFIGSPATWSPEATEEARDRILHRMQERTADEWMAIFDENGNVAAEPVLTTAEALDHRDIACSLIELDDPHVGRTTQIGPIARLERSPASPEPRRAPGDASSWIASASGSGVPVGTHDRVPGRPLDGVTILDLSTIIAGPLGMSMLADLGARVVKVEPFGGDPFRQLYGDGRLAVKTNLGKESICIDLKNADGQAVLHELVADADVLVHNFRGAVPQKLGIDPDTLWAINPRLVWAGLSGYSVASPSATRPATHPVIGASTGGVAHQAGPALSAECPTLAEVREAARRIMAANEANPDPNTSVVAASAVLLALADRERNHGQGQVVRIDMQTANAWANGDDFLRYDTKPDRPTPDDELHGLGATYRLYPTADGWVFLAAQGDQAFERFCRAAGHEDIARAPRFATSASRADHDDELVGVLTEVFATRSADDWQKLADHGIGCVRADGIESGVRWSDDPWIRAMGFAPETEHGRFGAVRRWGPLSTVGVRAADDPSRYRTAPLAGQQTDALLAELGRSPEDIEQLRANGVVNSEPDHLPTV